MEWNNFYFELPIFSQHFGPTQTCPFNKLYVSVSLYEDVTNRNEIVSHATEVNNKGRGPLPQSISSSLMGSEQLGKIMLSFDLVHLILQPEMVVSIEHVSHAISRAVTNILNEKIHCTLFSSEVAYMMGGSSDVTKCVNDMCVSIDLNNSFCKSMLVVTVSKTKYFGTIASKIKGVNLHTAKLSELTDKERVIQSFKFSKEELELPGGLAASVLGRVGTKRM